MWTLLVSGTCGERAEKEAPKAHNNTRITDANQGLINALRLDYAPGASSSSGSSAQVIHLPFFCLPSIPTSIGITLKSLIFFSHFACAYVHPLTGLTLSSLFCAHSFTALSRFSRLPISVDTGRQWSGDTNFDSGDVFVLPDSIILPNTDLQDVFRSERVGVEPGSNLRYTFTVPSGSSIRGYRVVLHFAEIYIGAAGAGLRVFPVFLQVGSRHR